MHLHQELEGFYLGTRDNRSYPMEVNTMKEIGHSNGLLNGHTTRRAAKHTAFAKQESLPRFVLLILEDFDEIRAFLARHFSHYGYDVFSSATLRDALAIAWEEEPQVIIIDYDLAGERSLHAIERLHDAKPNSYIVLIGGPGTEDVEERALAAGATRVLSKAYAIAEMDQIVERAMHIPVPERFSMHVV